MTIDDKIKKFASCAELMPGVVVIHDIGNLNEFKTVYMNTKGLEQLGVNLDQLSQMGPKYHERFFNNEDMDDYMKKLSKMLKKKDPDETFTIFQQVKIRESNTWVWHIASVRIFNQDETGNPTHLITVAFPIDSMKHIPHKAERLLAENNFFRNNLDKFLNLGKREKQVLRLVALGKSSAAIGEELNITVDTVNTHRKKIKQKLEINTAYEFTEYAHAFDLI